MTILKIKNSSGQWEKVYAVKGDKGDKGDTGPKGSTGSYSAGTGITIGTDNKVNLATVVTAGSAGPTTNVTPGFGGSFTVPQVNYDAYGRVTGRTNRTITLPAQPSSSLPTIGAQTFSSTYKFAREVQYIKVGVSRDAYGRLTGVSATGACDCQAD